jgi:hypothetical protein
MDAANVPGRKTTIAVFAVFLLMAIAFMFNQPGGPVTETTGVVQAFAFIPSDVGAPPQVASVRLTDGTVVQAQVRSGVLIQPGQVAKIRVYRRVITGTPAYELVDTKQKK